MSDAILVLNAGSSSIKFSLFEGHVRPGPRGLICDGEFDSIGHRVHFVAKGNSAASLTDRYLTEGTTHEDALATLLSWVERQFPDNPWSRPGIASCMVAQSILSLYVSIPR
jgi:acetate kinase